MQHDLAVGERPRWPETRRLLRPPPEPAERFHGLAERFRPELIQRCAGPDDQRFRSAEPVMTSWAIASEIRSAASSSVSHETGSCGASGSRSSRSGTAWELTALSNGRMASYCSTTPETSGISKQSPRWRDPIPSPVTPGRIGAVARARRAPSCRVWAARTSRPAIDNSRPTSACAGPGHARPDTSGRDQRRWVPAC